MIRESFEQWKIPKEVAGVLHFEDFTSMRGRMGVGERHRHDELEVHLLLNAWGTFLLGEDRVRAEAGTVVWVPPDVDHILLEAAPDLRRWTLLLRASAVRRVLSKEEAHAVLAPASAAALARTLPRPHVRVLASIYGEVRDQAFVSFPLHNAGMHFALARTWVLYRRAVATPETATLHPAVARAVRILRDSAPPPALPELARRSGLSRSRLSRLFVEQVGVSVTEFKNRQCVERFVDLYGDGTATTVTDAALDAGFGSYAQFYRVFTEVMGRTPAEHHRRSRGA